MCPRVLAWLLVTCGALVAAAQEAPPRHTFEATDRPWPPDLPTETLRDAFAFEHETFNVRFRPPTAGFTDPGGLAFHSLLPSEELSLRVVMVDAYPAHNDPDSLLQNEPKPAVLLVHSLHPDMPIATALARSVTTQGVHAFVVHLPGYGNRPVPEDRPDWPGVVALRESVRAVAEVRRACDAVAALPGVDPDRIVLQGTSLGSFPAAVAAGLNARHHGLVLLLGGGNVTNIIEHGQKDAANFRQTLERYGIDQAKRAELITPLEPLTIADRLNPKTTWLLAARNDTVVQPANALALADAVGLDETRFVQLPGNHYTASLALPAIADLLVRIAKADDPATLDAP